MPCILKIRVVRARGLPVMDKSSGATDAYVEVRLGELGPRRTEVSRRSLNPAWNENFVLEVKDDRALQDEMLEFKVWDYDVLQDDVIGVATVYMGKLLHASSDGSALARIPGEIRGWLPLYDSLHGLRGELLVQVKVELFTDHNPFKDTSAGVFFFTVSMPPPTFVVQQIVGFVEELQVDDDPEYSIGDSFRAMRTSNDMRHGVFSSLSLRLRRLVGSKVLALGGSAVLGYSLSFDIEGDRGIVARASGTAAVVEFAAFLPACSRASQGLDSTARPRHPGPQSPLHRPGLDPDGLSPGGGPGVGMGSGASGGGASKSYLDDGYHASRSLLALQLREVRLLTLDAFPKGVVRHIGGMVMARSVKVAQRARMREKRDGFWREVRDEVRAHAQSLGCSYVAGYKEHCCVRDDVVVFTAYGTACNLRLKSWASNRVSKRGGCICLHGRGSPAAPAPQLSLSGESAAIGTAGAGGALCGVCGRASVPSICLSSIDLPGEVPIIGEPVFLEARVCRLKKKASGETEALTVSETIPFVEIALHRQLVSKMSLLALNAVFSVRSTISVGDGMIIGTLSGTGVFLNALPLPLPLRITRTLVAEGDADRQLSTLQRSLMELSRFNADRLKRVVGCEQEGSHDNVLDGADSSSDHDSGSANGEADGTRNAGSKIPAGLVVSVDSEVDEDNLGALYDPSIPFALGSKKWRCAEGTVLAPRTVIVVYRFRWSESPSGRPNQLLASLVHMAHARLLSSFAPAESGSSRVLVQGLRTSVSLPPKEAWAVDVTITAAILVKQPALFHSLPAGQGRAEKGAERRGRSKGRESVGTSGRESASSARARSRSAERGSGAPSGARGDGSSASKDRVAREKEKDSTQSRGPRSRSVEQRGGSVSGKPGKGGGDGQSSASSVGAKLRESIGRLRPPPSPSPKDHASGGVSATHVSFAEEESDGSAEIVPTDAADVKESVATNQVGLFEMDGADSPTVGPSPPPPGDLSAATVSAAAGPGVSTLWPQSSRRGSEWQPSVEVTPLLRMPGKRIVGGVGRLEFTFIRESTAVRECGGVAGFMHSGVTHALAVVRAHVAALGANCLVGFEFECLSLVANSSRDQAYCLFVMSGDAVTVLDKVQSTGDL